MIAELTPGLILIFGGLLVPLLPARLRPFLMIILPFVAFAHLLTLPDGEFGHVQIMGLPLVTLRVDKLSLMFGYVFLLAAFLGGLYALHVRDSFQQSAGLIYAGSAIGAVFAGDLVTLFIFWEGVAIASVFLIWAARQRARLSRRHALYRGPDRFGCSAVRRCPDPLPADGFARFRRDRPRFARGGTDLPRLWHQVRVPAAAQLAAGCLSGSDRYRHSVAFRRSPRRSPFTRSHGDSRAQKFWCRSAQ